MTSLDIDVVTRPVGDSVKMNWKSTNTFSLGLKKLRIY